MTPGNFPDFAREQSYPTPLQNSPLLPLLLLSLTSQKHTPDTKPYFLPEYDYIIVGAGSGGSVVARRLSEEQCVTVLLLEAGPAPPLLTDVPGFVPSFSGTDIDWNYFSQPQKHTARLLRNKQVPFNAGKVIGGSSILNFMLYMRGNPKNYDEWEALGAKGWNWNKVFRYFLKAEDNRDPEFLRNGYHSAGGPLTVERYAKASPFADPAVQAMKRLRYPCVDSNGPSQLGISDFQGSLRNHQRCSVAKAYLVPAENRTNLDIVAGAFVTKILIRHSKAIGVRFDYKGSGHKVKARKEVILSAGALNTPKLLMLSGIGPEKHLRNLGISVVKDLPGVGQNLHDHEGPYAFFSADSNIPPVEKRFQDQSNTLKYINSRDGLLASIPLTFALAFWKDYSVPQYTSVPDYQVYFGEVVIPAVRTPLNIDQQAYDKVLAPYENGTNLICFVQLLSPRSRGYVSLKSSDPYEPPLIQPNFFQDPKDVRLAVSGLKECHKVLESPEMQRLGVKRIQTVIPGCETVYGNEDLYFECIVRAFCIHIWHPVGTARMGNPAHPSTVVDPNLRVKGIKGLRVVDASVMPLIPAGNTNAVVIMIAEKASDLIKSDIRLSGGGGRCFSDEKKDYLAFSEVPLKGIS